jgi:Cof subfamily protein (haloacid dehalogenase superfamily)
MAEIRLIVTDLDGTFLVSGNDAHAENARAIRHAQEHGIMVCAVTSRSWTMCRSVVRRYGFEPYTIASGGACIVENQTDQPLFIKTIQPTALLPLLYTAYHTGIEAMQVCCIDECAVFGQAAEDRFGRRARADAQQNILLYRSFLDFFYSVEARSEQVCLFTKENAGLLPATLSEIVEALDAFDLTTNSDGAVGALPRGCGRAKALELLCDQLRISRENVLALGSNTDDIPMLHWAGVGVAMGQADEMVKRAADIVTVDNKDAGVAKAIYEVAMGYHFD